MPTPSIPARDACYRWLLAACRSWLQDRAGRLAVPASPLPAADALDWAMLGAMAHYQGVEPILHVVTSQQASFGSQVPEGLAAAWERAYYGTRIRNSEVLRLLARLSKRCDEIGVPILVLKGPSLLAEVYGDVGLRPMADLDLLCRLTDLLALRDILTAAGFDKVGTPYLHQVDFYCARENALIEVHFTLHHLVRNKARFLEGAWREPATASIEEWRFPVLPPHHQIVFELGHASWHGFDLDLRHIVDFAGRLLPGSPTVNPARLSELLEDTGLVEEYALLRGAVSRMLDLPLDGPIGSGPTPDRGAEFERRLREQSSSIGFVRKRSAASEFRRQSGLVRKAAFAWKRLVPPLAAMRAAYNLRTPMQAALCIPVHVARTAAELYSRARSGF